MSNSLRDKLLGLGFAEAPKPAARPRPEPVKGRSTQGDKPGGPPPRGSGRGTAPRAEQAKRGTGQGARRDAGPARASRTREDIDLAKAYAIRAQREKEERIEAERLKQEEARKRREAKAALAQFLADKALNAPEAEHVRHFEYGGKIKRIHVTADQLQALNSGALGVVQLDGRYLLVDADTLAQAGAIFGPAVALRVDPNAPQQDDPYADPRYQVPDDLVW